MKVYIAGFKELSLIDYPDEPSCVFWFSGCNFKCPYCYNYFMWEKKSGREMEINKLKELMRNSALISGACKITGGEPTLQSKALIELGLEAREIGMKFGVDTNGSNPRIIRDLIFKYECLDALAIDIKAPFTIEHYSRAIGISANNKLIDNIRETIEEALNSKCKLELRIPLIPLINDSPTSLRLISEELVRLGYLDAQNGKNKSIVLVEVITEKSADYNLRKTRKLKSHEIVELALTVNLPNTYIRHRELGGKVKVEEAAKILKF